MCIDRNERLAFHTGLGSPVGIFSSVGRSRRNCFFRLFHSHVVWWGEGVGVGVFECLRIAVLISERVFQGKCIGVCRSVYSKWYVYEWK